MELLVIDPDNGKVLQECRLADFLRANRDGLSADAEHYLVCDLVINGSARIGGGAAPLLEIRRKDA